MKILDRVTLNRPRSMEIGDVSVLFKKGQAGTILNGHRDNDDGLEGDRKLWLVALPHPKGNVYHVWMRAICLTLDE